MGQENVSVEISRKLDEYYFCNSVIPLRIFCLGFFCLFCVVSAVWFDFCETVPHTVAQVTRTSCVAPSGP